MRKVIKYVLVFTLLILIESSCHTDEKDITIPEIKIEKVFVKDFGEFKFRDSLTIAAADSIQYSVKIITDPSTADIYYSVSPGNFKKNISEWILIGSEMPRLNFYVKLDHFKTEVKTLNFSFKQGATIENATLYPNPCTDYINIGFESETRGELEYQIMTLSGQLIQTHKDFVNVDSYIQQINLSHLDPGPYLVKLKYGNTVKTTKFYKL